MSQLSKYRPSGRTEYARLKRQLDDLFDRADKLDPSEEVSGDLNRYICVRVAGFLEQGLASAGRACCERLSGAQAQAFALSWLEKLGNPRSAQIVKLVGRFDKEWEKEVERFLAEEERYSRINALMGIRNDVAHGKNQGVSREQARGYYALVCELLELVLDRLDPIPQPV